MIYQPSARRSSSLWWTKVFVKGTTFPKNDCMKCRHHYHYLLKTFFPLFLAESWVRGMNRSTPMADKSDSFQSRTCLKPSLK